MFERGNKERHRCPQSDQRGWRLPADRCGESTCPAPPPRAPVRAPCRCRSALCHHPFAPCGCGCRTPAHVASHPLGIEHGFHDIKEVTWGEDRSPLHASAGPIVRAMLRDTAISMLHYADWRTIAARVRYHCTHPEAARALCRRLPEYAYALGASSGPFRSGIAGGKMRA